MQFERDGGSSEGVRPISDLNEEHKKQNAEGIAASTTLSDSSDSSSSFQDDDDDSLELSESESITDVTPLNSPYCDSPMPQARDRLQPDAGRSADVDGRLDDHGEMNVLMQAIEKLEVEKNRRARKQRGGTADPFTGNRRVEPENQRLFKQAVSQQSRAKKATQDRLCRRSTVINRYKAPLNPESGVAAEDASRESLTYQSNRKQKCLSHPSCQPYPYSLSDSQHPCGLASKTLAQRPIASAEVTPDVESEMIAH